MIAAQFRSSVADKTALGSRMSTAIYKAYVQSELADLSGVKLVELLYRGAIDAIDRARSSLVNQQPLERAQHINRAYEILAELLVSLDQEAGGELARRLAALYIYTQNLLLKAHAEQSESPLIEARQLLSTLLEAWQEIGRQNLTAEANPARKHDSELPAGQLNCLA